MTVILALTCRILVICCTNIFTFNVLRIKNRNNPNVIVDNIYFRKGARMGYSSVQSIYGMFPG